MPEIEYVIASDSTSVAVIIAAAVPFSGLDAVAEEVNTGASLVPVIVMVISSVVSSSAVIANVSVIFSESPSASTIAFVLSNV